MTTEATEGRAYARTHPWLTFSFDLRRLKHTDWLALGEAASMSGHVAGTALDPAVAEELHRLYLAKGALATTAIEGNTLSEEEARGVIDGTLTLPPSRRYLAREIDNIVSACGGLVDELEACGRIPLTVERIERMNEAVLRGLDVEDDVAPGRVRKTNVSVGACRCPNWREAQALLARLCGVLDDFDLPAGNEHAFAILKAIFAHLHLVWIHPFGAGNGRTARLIELAILLEAGLPLPACHLLSNHYNLTRSEYHRQLARASRAEDGLLWFRVLRDRRARGRLARAGRAHSPASVGRGVDQLRPCAIPRRRRHDRPAAACPGAGVVAGSGGGRGRRIAGSECGPRAGLCPGHIQDAGPRRRGLGRARSPGA